MGDHSLENVDRILEEVLPPEEKLQEHESQAQKSGYVGQEEQVGARGKIPPGFNLSTKTPESFPMGEQISSDEDWDENCSSEKILHLTEDLILREADWSGIKGPRTTELERRRKTQGVLNRSKGVLCHAHEGFLVL